MSSTHQLTPKARVLYKRARAFKSVAGIYKTRLSSFRRRLKFANNHIDLFNSQLRSEAINFCLQQLNRKPTKSTGVRFTYDEKLMALALYKTSGPGYRFLSKWFKLPSRRTLTRLLHNVPVESGLNKFLLDNLKESVKHFKKNEKLCTLIFDEIALMPSVNYDTHTDTLIGLENGEICDHALVFMLRGVTRKWKQTVCYKFCKGTTQAVIIKELLVTLIKEVKNAGNFHHQLFLLFTDLNTYF